MRADGRTVMVAGRYGIALLGAMALVAGLMGPARSLGLAGTELPAIAATLRGLAFAGMAWRRTDEAAREAHEFAVAEAASRRGG